LRWPYDVRAICEDHEGNLWLGTSGGGLVQLRPQPVHVMRTTQGLPNGLPAALALDAAGRVYVGLQRGGLYVGDAGRFERFGGMGSLELQDAISSLSVARDGTVWAGTLGGGLYGLRGGRGIQITTANGLADDQVLATCVDANGNVWASTAAGTLHRFTATNAMRFDAAAGLGRSPVTTLIPARGDGIWLGTEDGAVLRGAMERFESVQSGEASGRRPVLALHESEGDRLWIGRAGGGLSCIAGAVTATWTTTNGLPHNYVAGIVEDASGNLWLVTGAGIYRISRSAWEKTLADPKIALAGKLIAYGKTTSESVTTVGGVRALQAGEGKLWFATAEDVVNVDTRRPETEAGPLPVYIESVAFNDDPQLSVLRDVAGAPPATNLNLMRGSGEVRSLRIHFTALSFTTPEKTRFRHKLENFDVDWVEDGTERVARYGRLPYGRYTFRVAARHADGAWQEAAANFAFEVPTPLYLQPWMIGLYGVAAVALVTGIVRVVSHRRLRHALAQLEQQQALERERMRIARDMHDEIGSKLTKISFLSEHARVDAKSESSLAGKIESIAETSRDLLQTMDEIVWVVNPRNDTLEHLAAYLSHYADEYFQNTSVECELRLPQAIAHYPVSSETRHNLFLAFEETLNNVLKHSGATNVKVEMIVKPLGFEILTTDNGRGFEVAAKAAQSSQNPRGGRGGNGLRNMRQRLADVGGECEVRSQPGQGTTIALRIRLQANSVKKA
jgi:signal transduction histidine kinase